MLFAFARRGRSPFAALALVALTGCIHETKVTVRDARLVGASVHDVDGRFVDLPADGAPGEIDAVMPGPSGFAFGGPLQRLSIVREDDGTLRYEAPDTTGHERGVLVSPDGSLYVPHSYLGADDVARFGTDLRMRYMIEYDATTRRRTYGVPAFEIWLHTPLSNFASGSVHTAPIRPLAIPFFILATVLGGATIGMLSSKDHATRTAGAGVLGGLSLAFGTGGTLLLALPATDSPIDTDR